MNLSSRSESILLALAALSLGVLAILAPALATFHDDSFYHFGYLRNGAYEQLDEEMAWAATENVQAYLRGSEELKFFSEDQAAHLAEVKEVYGLGVRIAAGCVIVFMVMIFLRSLAADRLTFMRRLLRCSGIVTLVLCAALVVVALRWEWFFTVFHETLFVGEWQFHPASLMIRLWGGDFFVEAGKYVLAQAALIGLLFLGARALWDYLERPAEKLPVWKMK